MKTHGGISGRNAPPQWPRNPVWQQLNPAPHSDEFMHDEPVDLRDALRGPAVLAARVVEMRAAGSGDLAALLSLVGTAEGIAAARTSAAIGAAELEIDGMTAAEASRAATAPSSGALGAREQANANRLQNVSASRAVTDQIISKAKRSSYGACSAGTRGCHPHLPSARTCTWRTET